MVILSVNVVLQVRKKKTQNNKLDCNPPSPQRELTGVRVLSARGLVLCFRPRAHEFENLLLNQRRSMFHLIRGEQDCYLVCKFKSLETEATFTRRRTNFCADKNLHGSTLRSHGIGETGRIFERLRLRLHGSGQIFVRTNFVPGPPLYMEQCKFCYRSQSCFHGSVQIFLGCTCSPRNSNVYIALIDEDLRQWPFAATCTAVAQLIRLK